jgi:hypothetical protein
VAATFTDRLAGSRKRLVLWLTISGIEPVFAERDLDVDDILGEARTVHALIPSRGIEVGESTLDLERMREIGGSLRFRLRQKFGTSTLTDLLQTLRRPRTFITSDVTTSGTTFSLSSASAFTAPGTFYVGNETVTFTGKSSNDLTSCTRGKYGSRAQAHVSDGSTGGASVFDVPPGWLGRRVKLYGSFMQDDGTTTSDLTQLLGTFSIEESPTFIDSMTVEVHCAPCIDEYLGRPLYVGYDEVRAGEASVADDGENVLVAVDDARRFEPGASFVTYALLKRDDGMAYIGRIVDADALLSTITVKPGAGFYDPLILGAFGGDITPNLGVMASARHIAIIGGTTGMSIVRLLVSRYGDTAGGTYDVIPGVSRSNIYDADAKFGANIAEDDIDPEAIYSIGGPPWAYVLDQTVTVGDVLREWCLVMGVYAVVDEDGKLTVKQSSETADASALTITSAMLAASAPPRAYVDESAIKPVIEFAANYSPSSQELQYVATHSDAEMQARYPARTDIARYEFKGISVDLPELDPSAQRYVGLNRMSRVQLDEIARRLQKADGRGRLLVEIRMSMRGLALHLGDVVTPSFEAPNYKGGSISGTAARVIGKRPRFDDGTVDVRLQILDRLFLIAPSAVVTAVSTTSIANDTVTLSTTDPTANNTSPANNFAVGMVIRLWDVSAGTSQTLTIASIPSVSSLRFTAGVSGTVETGVDFLTWSTKGVNSSLTSVAGNDEADLMMFETEPVSDPDGDGVRRWR